MVQSGAMSQARSGSTWRPIVFEASAAPSALMKLITSQRWRSLRRLPKAGMPPALMPWLTSQKSSPA